MRVRVCESLGMFGCRVGVIRGVSVSEWKVCDPPYSVPNERSCVGGESSYREETGRSEQCGAAETGLLFSQDTAVRTRLVDW